MTKLVGSYSIRNLIQSTEFLLKITRSLNDEINNLEKIRDEVRHQQNEATKQGLLVKKMTSYMSEELARMEQSNYENKKNSSVSPKISTNLEKLTGTETKLRVLRGRLTEFIEGGDEESLKATDTSLSIELKQYESFLLTLTTTLNEKIASLEKIASRINAEKRESEQQKLLLKEMVELFNNEIEDLEQTLKELKE
jgi:CII-binding regulator of phage lambda lysogenization HflD